MAQIALFPRPRRRRPADEGGLPARDQRDTSNAPGPLPLAGPGDAGRGEPSRGLTVEIPLRLVNETNAREHHMARARRAKSQRRTTALVLRSRFGAPPPPPLRITITRIGPRRLDSDNLAASGKHVRDGVANWLGVDDGSDLLTWEYAQRRDALSTVYAVRHHARLYAVEIRIEARR